MRPLPWLQILQHFWARRGLLGPGPPAVLTSVALSSDLGSCPSLSLAMRLRINTIPGKPQTQFSTATRWARQPRPGAVGHSTLWLGGYCSVVWLLLIVWLCSYCNRWVLTAVLDYKPLVALSPAFRKARVCVCVRERETEREHGFSIFTAKSCSKAVQATFRLQVTSTQHFVRTALCCISAFVGEGSFSR